MNKIPGFWIRNEQSPPQLHEHEFIGPARQDTFIDPLSKSDYLHKGYTVEELKEMWYVGIYREKSL
jgi:hypothetical protein